MTELWAYFWLTSLEEEARPLRVHRGVAQLVDDQEFLPAQLLEVPPERARDLRGNKAVEQRGRVGEEDPLAREARLHGPGQGEVGLRLVMRMPSYDGTLRVRRSVAASRSTRAGSSAMR